MLKASSSLLITAAVLTVGCKSIPSIPPTQPPLTLLSAGSLDLPNGCVASGVVTVAFTVATSGVTRDVQAVDAPACVAAALTVWVESFRYEPPARDTPTKIEWMMVTAPRQHTGG